MKKYVIHYDEYLRGEFIKGLLMEFDAENLLHVVNQLLDYYRTYDSRVSCIQEVRVDGEVTYR